MAVKNGARTIGAGHFSGGALFRMPTSTIYINIYVRARTAYAEGQTDSVSDAINARIVDKFGPVQPAHVCLIHAGDLAAGAEARDEKGARIKSPLYAPCIDKCAT